jgi:hypothetical protein
MVLMILGILKYIQLSLAPFLVEIAIEKLKRYKSPGIDQILAELIRGGEYITF